jgi:single-strand selective monofunctional uracil DNA glycosylase
MSVSPREGLVAAATVLRAASDGLTFAAPVTHVYNPLDYAWRPHRSYLERFGGLGASVLLLGMNPGPFGMAQTGVPFGDVTMVRDWLGIEEPVARPSPEHPKRPVLGFESSRGEVSGARLWGWARDAYRTPARFFARFFVWNYCPLSFMEASGRNRTPDKLPRTERDNLFAVCNEALERVVEALAPAHVVGIGRFAHQRVEALGLSGIETGWGPHPSPASPVANRGWAEQFEAALGRLGIDAR